MLLTLLFKVYIEAGLLVAFLLVSQHYEALTERRCGVAVLGRGQIVQQLGP